MNLIKKAEKIDLKELGNEGNYLILERKLKRSENLSKTLVWLYVRFFQDKVSRVTAKELSKFLKKVPQQTLIILNEFTLYGILDNHSRGQFQKTLFSLKDATLLGDLLPTAKERLGLK